MQSTEYYECWKPVNDEIMRWLLASGPAEAFEAYVSEQAVREILENVESPPERVVTLSLINIGAGAEYNDRAFAVFTYACAHEHQEFIQALLDLEGEHFIDTAELGWLALETAVQTGKDDLTGLLLSLPEHRAIPITEQSCLHALDAAHRPTILRILDPSIAWSAEGLAAAGQTIEYAAHALSREDCASTVAGSIVGMIWRYLCFNPQNPDSQLDNLISILQFPAGDADTGNLPVQGPTKMHLSRGVLLRRLAQAVVDWHPASAVAPDVADWPALVRAEVNTILGWGQKAGDLYTSCLRQGGVHEATIHFGEDTRQVALGWILCQVMHESAGKNLLCEIVQKHRELPDDTPKSHAWALCESIVGAQKKLRWGSSELGIRPRRGPVLLRKQTRMRRQQKES